MSPQARSGDRPQRQFLPAGCLGCEATRRAGTKGAWGFRIPSQRAPACALRTPTALIRAPALPSVLLQGRPRGVPLGLTIAFGGRQAVRSVRRRFAGTGRRSIPATAPATRPDCSEMWGRRLVRNRLSVRRLPMYPPLPGRFRFRISEKRNHPWAEVTARRLSVSPLPAVSDAGRGTEFRDVDIGRCGRGVPLERQSHASPMAIVVVLTARC